MKCTYMKAPLHSLWYDFSFTNEDQSNFVVQNIIVCVSNYENHPLYFWSILINWQNLKPNPFKNFEIMLQYLIFILLLYILSIYRLELHELNQQWWNTNSFWGINQTSSGKYTSLNLDQCVQPWTFLTTR